MPGYQKGPNLRKAQFAYRTDDNHDDGEVLYQIASGEFGAFERLYR